MEQGTWGGARGTACRTGDVVIVNREHGFQSLCLAVVWIVRWCVVCMAIIIRGLDKLYGWLVVGTCIVVGFIGNGGVTN